MSPVPRRGGHRRARLLRRALVISAATLVALAIASPAAAASTPVQRWLAQPFAYAAHRGGSDDWPEGSPLAYRRAIAWSPTLALEAPVFRTADGVWVVSHDATTGRVYGTDRTIADSTWAQLSTLRSTVGGQPMARLVDDLLAVAPRGRVLFVDDKADADTGALLDLLDRYGGAGRTVVKAYWASQAMPAAAHARGYTTWGYYYAAEMDRFDATQGVFDLLGMEWSAPAATFDRMLATGKRVFGHVVDTDAEADEARAKGATGLMVAGVREVVPRG